MLVQRTVCLPSAWSTWVWLFCNFHIDDSWRKWSGTLFIQHFGGLPRKPDAAVDKPSVCLHMLPIWPVALGELSKSEIAKMSQVVSPNSARLMREKSRFLHRSSCLYPSPLVWFSTKIDQYQTSSAEAPQILVPATPKDFGSQNSTSFTSHKAFAGVCFICDTFLGKTETKTKPGKKPQQQEISDIQRNPLCSVIREFFRTCRMISEKQWVRSCWVATGLRFLHMV